MLLVVKGLIDTRLMSVCWQSVVNVKWILSHYAKHSCRCLLRVCRFPVVNALTFLFCGL